MDTWAPPWLPFRQEADRGASDGKRVHRLCGQRGSPVCDPSLRVGSARAHSHMRTREGPWTLFVHRGGDVKGIRATAALEAGSLWLPHHPTGTAHVTARTSSGAPLT